MYGDDSTDQKELAYDLRQYYARILGEHLVDAMEHRKTAEFYEWFKALEDIKTITIHKWKDKKNNVNEYNQLINDIKSLANKYPEVWNKKSTDPYAYSLIENRLRDLEEFLYSMMEKANIFGESWSNPEL